MSSAPLPFRSSRFSHSFLTPRHRHRASAGQCRRRITIGLRQQGSRHSKVWLLSNGIPRSPPPRTSMPYAWPRLNQLSHQFPGEPSLQDRARQAGARFSTIAENVAQGPTLGGIHTSMDEFSSASRQSSRSDAKLRRYLRRPVRQHAVRRRGLLHGRARVFPGSTGAQSRLSTRLAGPGCSDWNAGRPQNLPTR